MSIQVSISAKIYIVVWIMTSCSLAGGYHVLGENTTYLLLHFWIEGGGNSFL
jgi:hypothetical protein